MEEVSVHAAPSMYEAGVNRVQSWTRVEMSKILAKAALIALSIGGAVTAVNAQDISKMNGAVAYCVDTVHHFPADPSEIQFFKKFDAYYNTATGKIENNGLFVGDQAALYQFNKCMASQGVPLTYGANTTTPPPPEICTDEKLDADGECWIKLSPWEKQVYVRAFDEGWFYGEDVRQKRSYSSEGKSSFSKGRYIGLSNVIEYFDNLYNDSQNKSINIVNAFDLAVRADMQKKNPSVRIPYTVDIPKLISMYRQRESPIIYGLSTELCATNKVNISRFSDNLDTAKMLQQFASVGAHNYSQTITMLGVSLEPSGPDVDRFMRALTNAKECNTLTVLTEEYKYINFLAEDQRSAFKELEKQNFYPQINVIVAYPTDYSHQNLYFNKKGELAGIILLDRSERVCLQPHDQKLTYPKDVITLGSLMTTGAKDEKRYAEPRWLDPSTRSDFINLSEYLTNNDLLKRSDLDKSDPQIEQGDTEYKMRWFDDDPVKEGINKVLTVGGASGESGRSN